MGWDAFGLPAEHYAIENNVHPRDTTRKNIDNFRRQIKSLGFSYDWDREVDTTDPRYYRWTQWIFLQLFDTWYDSDHVWTDRQGRNQRTGKGRPIAELPIPEGTADPGAYRDSKRLAYRAEVPVNWCPKLGTVLANEEVIDGLSERGGYPVVRMPLRQWMLRITAYADRLIEDLELVDWPKPIRDMQRNWIGRSEGAEVDFTIADDAQGWSAGRARSGFPEFPEADVIRVFTTRPDTLFGATYMVLAPEHPLVDRLTTPEQKARRSKKPIEPEGRVQERPRADRVVEDQDGRLHRRICRESRQWRADPRLDRRLRPRRLRHRRHHGRTRSRRARLLRSSKAFQLPIVRPSSCPTSNRPGKCSPTRSASSRLERTSARAIPQSLSKSRR